MAVNTNTFSTITKELNQKNVRLVAVSKTKSFEEILELYNSGQRDFGENYVQELIEKYQKLPKDIHWHFIGHLQSNKVKLITPFVSLIQSVDSYKLLKEINQQAKKNDKVIDCLLQVHIASEETKFGLNEDELNELFNQIKETNKSNVGIGYLFENVRICGLMGMASFTNDIKKVKEEFRFLKSLFNKYANLSVLSMGMSGDYKIAIEEGSNMVRIGSLLFGERTRQPV